MPKRSIRSQFLAERKMLPTAACADLSVAIQQRFLHSELYHNAKCLALYSAIHNEVLTDAVARQSVADGKAMAYPRINNDDLEFVVVKDLDQLAPGAFGVLEPQSGSLVPTANLDLIIVPGVVFDQGGHRLGYGRGFYDRTLKECRVDCIKLGFAFDFQLIESLPTAEHDQLISVLMTETRMLNFSA